MTVTSSNGTIFKNTAITTTLTAHVYKAGAELDATAIAALGTIKWYKDGSTTALSTTGQTLNIGAGDIENKAKDGSKSKSRNHTRLDPRCEKYNQILSAAKLHCL